MVPRKKQRRTRRKFTAEFKAEAVRLCRVGDRTITQVAADLDSTAGSSVCSRPSAWMTCSRTDGVLLGADRLP